jgi:hypothetical protein
MVGFRETMKLQPWLKPEYKPQRDNTLEADQSRPIFSVLLGPDQSPVLYSQKIIFNIV